MKNRIKNLLRTWGPQLLTLAVMAGMAAVFTAPTGAEAAFNPTTAAENTLAFFQLILIVAACVIGVACIMRSQIVGAVVTIAVAAFIYVMTEPGMITDLGDGIKGLFGIGS